MRNAPPQRGHFCPDPDPLGRTDRPLLAVLLSETGLSDGFSLERLLNRLDQGDYQK